MFELNSKLFLKSNFNLIFLLYEQKHAPMSCNATYSYSPDQQGDRWLPLQSSFHIQILVNFFREHLTKSHFCVNPSLNSPQSSQFHSFLFRSGQSHRVITHGARMIHWSCGLSVNASFLSSSTLRQELQTVDPFRWYWKCRNSNTKHTRRQKIDKL